MKGVKMRRLWHFPTREFEATRKRWDFGGSKKAATEGIHAAGTEMYNRSKMTPEETAQYQGSFKMGDLLRQLSEYQAGVGPQPAGYQTPEQIYQQQGPLSQSYYNQVLAGTQDPYAAWESSLAPQLQQAQDTINRTMQGRGLLQSGMNIESMGRAGVDLSIRQAQERMAARSQELARGGELSQYAGQLGQQGYSNMSNLYGQQQQYGLQGQQRQANAAGQWAQYQAYPYQMALGQAAGQNAAMWSLPGQALSAGAMALGGGIPNYLGSTMLGSGGGTTPATSEVYPGVQSLVGQRSQGQYDPTKFKLGSQLEY